MLSLPPITLRLRGWKLIDRVALAFLLLCAISLGAAGGLLFVYASDLPEIRALETYRLATMLGFILREGCAIVGLMTTLLTNQPGWCYALSAAALIAMFMAWPRREELAGVLAHGAA